MGGHEQVINQILQSKTYSKNSDADSDKDEIKTLDSFTYSEKVISADTNPDTGLSENFDLGVRQTSTCILNV